MIDYRLVSESVDDHDTTDPDTLDLLRDAQSVWTSVFQGMAPVGDWLQARIAHLVRGWIGDDWCISHGQVFDPANRARQTRSWDLIVHRRPRPEDRLPPPAAPDGPWALLPKHLCAAVIDTKGRYDTPRIYAGATALNALNDSKTPQLDLLTPDVKPALLVLASTRNPIAVMDEGNQHHLPTFVLARATDHKGSHGTDRVIWKLARTSTGTLPLTEFQSYVVDAVRAWQARNE